MDTLSHTIQTVALHVLDILLLSYLIYRVLLLVRGTRAVQVLFGLLFLVPVFMLLSPKRNDLGHLFRAAIFLMLAGALYRFDAYIVAFAPPGNWTYFPSVTEMLISLGLIAAEIMAFVIIVKYFPILGGTPARAKS